MKRSVRSLVVNGTVEHVGSSVGLRTKGATPVVGPVQVRLSVFQQAALPGGFQTPVCLQVSIRSAQLAATHRLGLWKVEHRLSQRAFICEQESRIVRQPSIAQAG
jgi:hypothetical protein